MGNSSSKPIGSGSKKNKDKLSKNSSSGNANSNSNSSNSNNKTTSSQGTSEKKFASLSKRLSTSSIGSKSNTSGKGMSPVQSGKKDGEPLSGASTDITSDNTTSYTSPIASPSNFSSSKSKLPFQRHKRSKSTGAIPAPESIDEFAKQSANYKISSATSNYVDSNNRTGSGISGQRSEEGGEDEEDDDDQEAEEEDDDDDDDNDDGDDENNGAKKSGNRTEKQRTSSRSSRSSQKKLSQRTSSTSSKKSGSIFNKRGSSSLQSPPMLSKTSSFSKSTKSSRKSSFDQSLPPSMVTIEPTSSILKKNPSRHSMSSSAYYSDNALMTDDDYDSSLPNLSKRRSMDSSSKMRTLSNSSRRNSGGSVASNNSLSNSGSNPNIMNNNGNNINSSSSVSSPYIHNKRNSSSGNYTDFPTSINQMDRLSRTSTKNSIGSDGNNNNNNIPGIMGSRKSSFSSLKSSGKTAYSTPVGSPGYDMQQNNNIDESGNHIDYFSANPHGLNEGNSHDDSLYTHTNANLHSGSTPTGKDMYINNNASDGTREGQTYKNTYFDANGNELVDNVSHQQKFQHHHVGSDFNNLSPEERQALLSQMQDINASGNDMQALRDQVGGGYDIQQGSQDGSQQLDQYGQPLQSHEYHNQEQHDHHHHHHHNHHHHEDQGVTEDMAANGNVNSAGVEATGKKPGKKPLKPIDIDLTIQKLLDAGYSGKRTKNLVLKNSEIQQICSISRDIFLAQPSLLELSPPVKIVGDVHGQFQDLIRMFDKCGFPPAANYLFLGDYVDRGKQSLETILLLLCYKIKYPENFFLLRGNHECASVTRVYGFYDECKRRCNIRTWKLFVDTFNTLPLAAIVAGKIFCVHGGLSPVLNSMDEVRHVSRPTDVPDFGLINDLLWSDPTDSINEWEDNERGVSYCYNKVAINKFLNRFGFDLVCRAHMVVEDGYEFFNAHTLVTVFSAPNYCGEFDNWGAVMSVSDALLCSFELLEPLDSAALKQVMKKGRQERKLAALQAMEMEKLEYENSLTAEQHHHGEEHPENSQLTELSQS